MADSKSPFAKVMTFAVIKKFVSAKSGRQIVIGDFQLTEKQLGEIDDLTAAETEILVSVEPSRRGTTFDQTDGPRGRIIGADFSTEVDAIGALVMEVAAVMRARMVEKLLANIAGWDDEAFYDQFLAGILKCTKAKDWIDAMNYIMMARNIERPIIELEPFEAGPEETQPELPLGEGDADGG